MRKLSIREFAHAWACCAFGGRIAHLQALFVHNSAYWVAERSIFYYHHILNILSMIIIWLSENIDYVKPQDGGKELKLRPG